MQDFSILNNPILNMDSYKSSHAYLYPHDASYIYSYIESRGGAGDETVFLGPQMFIKRYLSTPITLDHVKEAKDILTMHGLPFNEDGWLRIVQKHGGRWPLRIKAVKEGTRVAKHNILTSVENTDTQLAWLGSYLETAYIRACWYPTTVATTSFMCKQILRQYLRETSDLTGDDFEMKLAFMLHDFGARGVSSKESAEIGGLGHLVNFQGTDTIGAVLQARAFYHEAMAGRSIPASEHSTVTTWGRDHELDFYRHQLQTFGKPEAMFASVIDSYDQDRAIREYWGDALKEDLIASGAKLILRPDSGDPLIVVPRLLNIAGSSFGFSLNKKGYKVLPPYVGMIQGDGISYDSLPAICQAIMAAGWSLENMAFGMGGGLLQQVNRDTHKFAMKASAVYRRAGSPWEDRVAVAGRWLDVYKEPKDDPGKRSMAGRLGLYRHLDGSHYTGPDNQPGNQLETIFDDYELKRDQTFAEIRQLAA
jgi:nicotinamide phosphoribosyltransferase